MTKEFRKGRSAFKGRVTFCGKAGVSNKAFEGFKQGQA